MAVDAAGLAEHATHEEDIVPAPAGGCAASEEPAAPLPTLTATPAPTSAPGDVLPTPTATASPQPTGTAVEIVEEPPSTSAPSPSPDGGGAEPAELPPPLSATSPQLQEVPAPLARTGAGTGLTGAAGLALALCGIGLRLRLGNAPGRPVFGP